MTKVTVQNQAESSKLLIVHNVFLSGAQIGAWHVVTEL